MFVLVSLTETVVKLGFSRRSLPAHWPVPSAPEPQAAAGEAGPITSLLRRHEPKPMGRKKRADTVVQWHSLFIVVVVITIRPQREVVFFFFFCQGCGNCVKRNVAFKRGS